MTNLSEITFFLSKALRFDLNATLELKPLILNKVHLINSLRSENKTFFLQAGITSLPAITLNPIPNKDLRLLNKAIPFLIDVYYQGEDKVYLSAKARFLSIITKEE